jgi:Cytochrome P460
MPFPFSFRTFMSSAAAFVVLAAGAAASIFEAHGDESSQAQIAYPAGYRQWVHVKSGIIGPAFPMEPERGIHHVYANPTALAGLESGNFDDGSVLVYDLVSLSEQGVSDAEGARRRIDVMVKDSRLYAATAGWRFGRFMADDHEHNVMTPELHNICVQCHEKQKAHGMVFSEFRR